MCVIVIVCVVPAALLAAKVTEPTLRVTLASLEVKVIVTEADGEVFRARV